MIVFRLLLMALTTIMTVVTLLVGVSVMLGVGWIAVAIPVVIVLGIVAAGRMLWRRYVRPDGQADDGRG